MTRHHALGSAQERLARIGLSLPELLLPRTEVDLRLWAVNACDQHVHDGSYWDRARARIGGRPSALSLILPEADLGCQDLSDRILDIHRAMDGYLRTGILRPIGNGFMVVDRTISAGMRRTGLLVAFDLEAWHRTDRDRFALRPTESTVEDRLPARYSIREGAAVELPHVLALVDDPEGILSDLLETIPGRELYRADLAEDAGDVRGRLVEDRESVELVVSCLEGLAKPASPTDRVWFVGDGNHSLEVARRHWNGLRSTLDEQGRADHPARLLLAELVPAQSQGLPVLAVHRRVHGIDHDTLRDEFGKIGLASAPCASIELREDLESDAGRWIAGWTDGDNYWHLVPDCPPADRFDRILDGLLVRLQAMAEGRRIDYLHGWDESLSGDTGGCTIHVRSPSTRSLIQAFGAGEILPPKTFSLGTPRDKRHYLEARLLRPWCASITGSQSLTAPTTTPNGGRHGS